MWRAWREVFAPERVELDDDFFVDLAGHSLLAARMVSRLRKHASCESLSMLDVYKYPTVEQLAAHLASEAASREAARPVASEDATLEKGSDQDPGACSRSRFRPVAPRMHFCCGLAQAMSLYFTLALASLQWLAPYLTYTFMVEDRFSKLMAVACACLGLLAVYPAMLAVVIASKWILIGRYRAGSYPLWGAYYFRWWLAGAMQNVVPTSYLAGTPLLAIYYRLMGARVGRNVFLATDSCGSFDLVEIGDDASIGVDASLAGYTVADGQLHLGPIRIGRRAFVGTRAVVSLGASLADDAQLEDLSLLAAGDSIGPGERWVGSPAAQARSLAPARVFERPSAARGIGLGLMYAAGVFVFPLLALGAFLPGVMYLNHLDYRVSYAEYLLTTPLVALSFIVFLCLEIAAAKWLLLGRVRAGTYPVAGGFYFRKWFVDQLLELSLDVVGPLYATIYLAPWYRLFGAKLGKRAEISTASFISPDLLSIGEEGFIADAVSLGAARVERGGITIAETTIGARAFIGNSALVPSGATIGEGALIGCLSAPPEAPRTAPANTSWLGSPSFYLPSRQTSAAFAEEHTFKPSRKLWVQRATIEFFRITLPASVFLVITSALLNAILALRANVSLPALLALFPLVYIACGLAATLFVIAAKWALMGHYKPTEKPLWSAFVWRTELVTALHENLADLFLTGSLEGTPFLPWFFRLLGAKIGRRAWMETTALTEFDLITIGDDVALNHDATIQTHLFEDRVMKMSTIRIGDRATVVRCRSCCTTR